MSELSPREREVLAYVACGLTDEAIAERMFLERASVQRHVYAIFAKLNAPDGVHKRVHAVLVWREWEAEPRQPAARDRQGA